MTPESEMQALEIALAALNRPLGRVFIKRNAQFRSWPWWEREVWLADGRGDPIKDSKGTPYKPKMCQELFEALEPFLEELVVGQGEIGYKPSRRLLTEHQQRLMDRDLPVLPHPTPPKDGVMPSETQDQPLPNAPNCLGRRRL